MLPFGTPKSILQVGRLRLRGEGQEAADWLGWLQKLSGICPTEKVPRGLQREDSLVPQRRHCLCLTGPCSGFCLLGVGKEAWPTQCWLGETPCLRKTKE